jgi:hypothetical protein
MPSLYVAVYLADPPPARISGMAAAFYSEDLQSGFPYDSGDDPAFFSARHFGGPITWGVCRPDVRCSIRKGDGIVFFAREKDPKDIKTCYYRFVAALRVDEKMKHTALSTHPLFHKYLNLVIRPCGSGWDHYEPVANHPDWLWKVTCVSLARSQCLPKKTGRGQRWEAAGKTHRPGSPLTIDGRVVPVGTNYVIFSRSSAILADDPPRVARYLKGDLHEAWETDAISQKIRNLVLRDGCRYLRTSNLQQAHRHIRHQHVAESDLEDILRQLRSLTMRAE